MKRFAALLIAVVTCLAACSVGAWAEETAALVGTPGETVEIRFVVTANSNNAVAATIALEYKHTTLKLIPGGDFPNENGQAVLVDLKGIPVGKEVVATFRVSDSAQSKEIPITIRVLEAGDIDENQVDGLTFSSCSFRVDYLVPVFGLTTADFIQRAEEIFDACNQWEGGDNYNLTASAWQEKYPGIALPYPEYESFPLPFLVSSEDDARESLREYFGESQEEFCTCYSITTNRLIETNDASFLPTGYDLRYAVWHWNDGSSFTKIWYSTSDKFISWSFDDQQVHIMIDSLGTGSSNHVLVYDLPSGALSYIY